MKDGGTPEEVVCHRYAFAITITRRKLTRHGGGSFFTPSDRPEMVIGEQTSHLTIFFGWVQELVAVTPLSDGYMARYRGQSIYF
ncbi:hypothetical protein GWI33_018642 [Rhynchophorus ferrugineus]|uniref:Uncharacterized protein n=1 Tax=Rhynchophorus ferrugineus TaxID=354439 RepID=A0A834HZS7_RHYFE|nr:hypothetical protein GWI33_018642 [Rhynchophorus ferrugineus]